MLTETLALREGIFIPSDRHVGRNWVDAYLDTEQSSNCSKIVTGIRSLVLL